MANSPRNKRTILLIILGMITILPVIVTISIYSGKKNDSNNKSIENNNLPIGNTFEEMNSNSSTSNDIITKEKVEVLKKDFLKGDFVAANIIATYYHSVGDINSWTVWKERAGSQGSCLALSDLEAYYSSTDNKKFAHRSNMAYVKYNCDEDKSATESDIIREKINRL